jgi:hypothetical protein
MESMLLHAGGWRVETTWCDRDDTGPRIWCRAVGPDDEVRWCTMSQLQELLYRHGLDIGDLTACRPGARDEPEDGCE